MADAAFHFAFSVWIIHAAGQRAGAIVGQHVAVDRVQLRIVEVGGFNAFAEIVEHEDFGYAAELAEGFLVKFGPDAGAGLEAQQADAFTAEAEREHEQPRAPVFAGLGVADEWAGAVVDLRFLAGRGNDNGAGVGCDGAGQLAYEAFHALVAAGEAMIVDHVLPDGFGVAAARESFFDGVAEGLAVAGRGWFCGRGVGGRHIGGF